MKNQRRDSHRGSIEVFMAFILASFVFITLIFYKIHLIHWAEIEKKKAFYHCAREFIQSQKDHLFYMKALNISIEAASAGRFIPVPGVSTAIQYGHRALQILQDIFSAGHRIFLTFETPHCEFKKINSYLFHYPYQTRGLTILKRHPFSKAALRRSRPWSLYYISRDKYVPTALIFKSRWKGRSHHIEAQEVSVDQIKDSIWSLLNTVRQTKQRVENMKSIKQRVLDLNYGDL